MQLLKGCNIELMLLRAAARFDVAGTSTSGPDARHSSLLMCDGRRVTRQCVDTTVGERPKLASLGLEWRAYVLIVSVRVGGQRMCAW